MKLEKQIILIYLRIKNLYNNNGADYAFKCVIKINPKLRFKQRYYQQGGTTKIAAILYLIEQCLN